MIRHRGFPETYVTKELLEAAGGRDVDLHAGPTTPLSTGNNWSQTEREATLRSREQAMDQFSMQAMAGFVSDFGANRHTATRANVPPEGPARFQQAGSAEPPQTERLPQLAAPRRNAARFRGHHDGRMPVHRL
jgi:hypothetical protein